MKKMMVVTTLVLAAFISVPAFAGDPLSKPDVLSEETIMTDSKLSGYDTIVIKDFKMDDVKYSNGDSEEKPKVVAMKPMLVNTVSDSLTAECKLRKLFKTVERNVVPKGKAVVLEGEFTEINGGSRALRFWVGFGAGKTYLKVRGHLVDAETGKELATFEERETGYMGAVSMAHFEDLFPNQARSIGANVAEFIQKLY
jgi:hypothetical protein